MALASRFLAGRYRFVFLIALSPLIPTPYPRLPQGATAMPNPTPVQDFIRRWQASGAAARANFPQFVVELCDVLASLGQARLVEDERFVVQ